MIIEPKKPTSGQKGQILNIWTGLPNIRALSASKSLELSDSLDDTPRTLPTIAKHVPEIHAQLLDVLLHFLEPHQPNIKLRRRDRSLSLALARGCEQLSSTHSMEIAKSPLTTDAWAFGSFWPCIQEVCQTSDNLYENLRHRRAEIQKIRETMRPTILPIPGFTELLDAGTLSLIPHGISGSYFLLNEDSVPKFVIKPLDEDIGAINNPKGFASPFADSPLRTGIPLYRSCFREVAAFQIAELLEVSSIVPRTTFAIIQSDQFFDLSQQISPKEMQRYLDLIGPEDKEKLCSVQEYVVECKTLFEASQDLQSASLLDEEIEALLDRRDFENANILLWVTGDTDGHANNFLVTPKRVDAIGNQIFGLKKIDNGLAFPEVNGQLVNSLAALPNAKRPLSFKSIAKIQMIDPDAIAKILIQHGLDGSITAMRSRIKTLQAIIEDNPSISIKAINKKISKLNEKLV
jgi:hypothetical protein